MTGQVIKHNQVAAYKKSFNVFFRMGFSLFYYSVHQLSCGWWSFNTEMLLFHKIVGCQK
jgi:hypothetical protein